MTQVLATSIIPPPTAHAVTISLAPHPAQRFTPRSLFHVSHPPESLDHVVDVIECPVKWGCGL